MPNTPTLTIRENADGTHFLNAYWRDEADTTRRETIVDGVSYEAAARLKAALEAVADNLSMFVAVPSSDCARRVFPQSTISNPQ